MLIPSGGTAHKLGLWSRDIAKNDRVHGGFASTLTSHQQHLFHFAYIIVNQLIFKYIMIRDLPTLYQGLTKLRYLFMILLVSATITQIALSRVELISLLIGCLIYCLLGGERMAMQSYRILIIIQLGCCLYLGLKLLFMELDEGTEDQRSTAELVSILTTLLYLFYSIILTWRYYETRKLQIIIQRDFGII